MAATVACLLVGGLVVAVLVIRTPTSPPSALPGPPTSADRAAPAPDTSSSPSSGDPGTGQDLPLHQVPTTIPADCSADVTRDLNDYITTVPDGSRIVFPANACYWVEGSLTLERRHDLVVDGNGSLFRPRSRVPQEVNRAQWFLSYGQHLVLEDMTLSGVNADAVLGRDTAYDHNVFIRGSHNVTIDRVRGGNTFGDFVAIAQGIDQTTIPSDITVENSSATNVGRMGVSCVACDGWTVRNSNFSHVALSVFDLEIEGDGRPGRRVAILDNTVGAYGWSMFQLGYPLPTTGNDLSDIRVSGNVTTDDSADATCLPPVNFAFAGTRQRDVTVSGNRLVSRGDAVLIRTTDGVTVTGNTMLRTGKPCDSSIAVRVIASTGVDVRDNLAYGFSQALAVQ